MTDPKDVHPLAPEPGSFQEGPLETENSPESVDVRAGVEIGAIRYVLAIGLVLAIAVMLLAYFFGYLPGADTRVN